jgi:prophage tail gpP-like protein
MAGILDAAVVAASAGAASQEILARAANTLYVIVGTQRFLIEAWESIRIQRSIDQISGSFSISFADKWKQTFTNWDLIPGNEIIIMLGLKDVILRGWIDTLDVDVKNDDRTLTMTGRDLTADLVDSSAPTIPSEFKFVNILQLATIFVTPFGIPFAIDVPPGEPFAKFTVKQGETVFELLHRAAQLRGLILQSTEIGGLLITDRSSALSQIPTPIPLVQGQNVLEAKASYDYSDRFFGYDVKGQGAGNDLINRKGVTQILGTSTDPQMRRPARRKTIIADGSVDLASAQRRANWEATVRASKAVDVTIKVQGWRQDILQIGPLWRPNQLVPVVMPYVGLQGNQLLVRAVQFSKSITEGTTTTLSLTRPDAYVPNLPAVNPVFDPSLNLGWQFSPTFAQEIF